MLSSLRIGGLLALTCTSMAFQAPQPSQSATRGSLKASTATAEASTTWFSSAEEAGLSMERQKAQLLQVGAALDRGQAYNPTSGSYYQGTMEAATNLIDSFLQNYATPPTCMEDIEGEWELVLSTVPHGIFRSSPFFLAIQEAYEVYAEEKYFRMGEDDGTPPVGKADLFFRLHELQTCSWGVSKVGRVAQTITKDYLYSEFDTSIFSLTVIPILGWFKLLPTFGGCVVTAAKTNLVLEDATPPNATDSNTTATLEMTVDYTTSRPVPGLQGLGEWIWKIRVPVGAIWKLLPWNKGREATCRVFVRHVDNDFRIVEDVSGDYFVYTRPVVARPLDLAQDEA